MNAYQILGVEPTASDAEIRKAYRALAKQHHPDKKGGDAEKFKEVQRAYDKVGTPSARAAYDAGTEPVTADEINSILLKSFRAALAEDSYSRTIPRLLSFLDGEQHKHETRAGHYAKVIKHLRLNRNRVSTPEGVPNMYQQAVDAEIEGCESSIKQHQEAASGIKEVRKYLMENYSEGPVVVPTPSEFPNPILSLGS